MPAIPANLDTKSDPAKVLVFLAYDDVTLLDIAGPMQVFEAANSLRRKGGNPTPYDIRLATRTGGRVRSDVGVPMEACAWADIRLPSDGMVVVPGGPGIWDAETQASISTYLRSQPATMEIASVCIGAFLLGHAGLLSGRHAVTHWKYCKRLQADFPDTHVKADSVFINDGRIWTSAGVTAGIDLALAIVERDFGHSLAVDVARGLVVFLKRTGGQSQYSKILEIQAAIPDGRLSDLHAWITDNLHKPLPIDRLAERLGMSPRSFARYYVERTGTTPRKAIEDLRIDTAQRMLLDYPKLSIKRIADRCGFMDEERMRRAFLRQFNVTPSEFRDRFASTQEP
ncbi:GlxA family transcriptional regulator [Neorhizobium sp. NPDC001467]|uniref:GlxA family transcriptional regulator n=1 Tax=Neorhizobium sp. NPDC001467 TaxID=3390595 RepID=UPI003D076C96